LRILRRRAGPRLGPVLTGPCCEFSEAAD
jgi:hypothetical protein